MDGNIVRIFKSFGILILVSYGGAFLIGFILAVVGIKGLDILYSTGYIDFVFFAIGTIIAIRYYLITKKDAERIYRLLVVAGAGENVAKKVINSTSLLSKYKRLESKGCIPPETAVIMQDLLMGNNNSYNETLRH